MKSCLANYKRRLNFLFEAYIQYLKSQLYYNRELGETKLIFLIFRTGMLDNQLNLVSIFKFNTLRFYLPINILSWKLSKKILLVLIQEFY